MATPDNYYAERLREYGDFAKARDEVRQTLVDLDPAWLSGYSDTDITRLVRSWRIYVVSGLGIAQRQWFAPDAAGVLMAVAKDVTNYYLHPAVQDSLKSRGQLNNKDEKGNPYDHLAEMIRDRAKLAKVAYRVSGDPTFLDRSLHLSEQAVNVATLPQCRGLARVEEGVTLREVWERLPEKKSPNLVYGEFYKTVHEGYWEAQRPLIENKNIDRLRWLATKVQDESFRYAAFARGKHVKIIASGDIQDAQAILKEFCGGKRAKNSESLLRNICWRITSLGVNKAELKEAVTQA